MDTSGRLKILNRNQIKYLAIICMLIDHATWAFVPEDTAVWQVLRFFGRLTAPLMAYFLAEGYYYTKDRLKYGIRLFVFAVISWPCYSLFKTGGINVFQMGVIFTLFLAYINIWLWDTLDSPAPVHIMITFIMCYISQMGDWSVFVILWSLFFYLYKDRPVKMWTLYYLVSVYYMIMVFQSRGLVNGLFSAGCLVMPLIISFLYNGKSGSRNAFHKWIFYIFYPLHLFVLWMIKNNVT